MRKARALRAGHRHFLRDHVVDDMLDRLSAIRRTFSTALELGGGGAFRQAVAQLAAEPAAQFNWMTSLDLTAGGASWGVVGDEERLPFADQSFDLVVSPLNLHSVNDLVGALVQIRRSLQLDGLFLAAMLGGASLRELRECLYRAETELTGGAGFRIAPTADAMDMAGVMQRAGFALPVTDRDRLTVRYADPFRLFQDLRAMGETAAMTERTRAPLARRVLLAALADYQQRHADADGKLIATFDIIWITGWAPHSSQQKPLRPGAAQTRLADALGVAEHNVKNSR